MKNGDAHVLEELLAPFEARPLGVDRDEVTERRRGTAFGEELNRIQGAEPNAVRERLIRLWCLGQVNHEEFVGLVGEIGRKGLFKALDHELSPDGR